MKISPHAWPFVAGALALALIAGAFVHPLGAIPPLGFVLFSLWFFRDPERDVPTDPNILVSPADGTVIRARPDKMSIFMSVFNVHICRAPASGTVRSVTHHPGRFLAAWKDEASEQNERAAIDVDRGDRQVRFVLVAGLVARRIVCKVRLGQRLAAGELIAAALAGHRAARSKPPLMTKMRQAPNA